jgi:hypothetical protein
MADLIRSNKYRQYSDQKVLRLFSESPKGEALHFLQVEIDVRGLIDDAVQLSESAKPKATHSPWYYLFYLLLFMLFIGRFGRQLL